MIVLPIGNDAAQLRELVRVAPQSLPKPVVAASEIDDVSANTIDQQIRRVEMTPQISEYMVRIYKDQLEATGSKERATDAVKNSDVFRSFLKRHDLDVITTAVATSNLLDRIVRP